MATNSSETDRSDNDRKFVAFCGNNTGISQFMGEELIVRGSHALIQKGWAPLPPNCFGIDMCTHGMRNSNLYGDQTR